MTSIKNILLCALLINLSGAQASLKSSFEALLNHGEKGPYDCNARQTSIARYCYKGGIFPGQQGKVYFDAAFRNPAAHALARDKSLFVANLFSTNYHFLYAKHIKNNVDSTGFAIEHKRFMANPDILDDVTMVLRDTLIERFYNVQNPDTLMAKAFYFRGVAGSEYESVYLDYLIDYLTQHMHKRKHYQLAYEILRRYDFASDSNVSISLLRNQVDIIYRTFPEKSAEGQRFFELRNTIHNAINAEVIAGLKDFNRQYKTKQSTNINHLIEQIKAYYRVDIQQIAKLIKQESVKAAMHADVSHTVAALAAGTISINKLLAFSNELVKVKHAILKSSTHRSIAVLRFLVRSNDYIQRKLDQLPFDKRQPNHAIISRIKVILNVAYTAGSLKSAQWQKITGDITDFNQKVTNRDDVQLLKAVDYAATAIFNANDNVVSLYGKSLQRWQSIDPAMEGIIDDTLKSSTLIQLANLSKSITTDIQGSIKRKIMWSGETYGYLSYISKSEMLSKSKNYTNLNEHSIPVFQALPLDLTVVAGVITEQFQTDLDHINLKSKQRNTPNLVFPDILHSSNAALVKQGSLVRMRLKNGEISITEATQNDAEQFWNKIKPQPVGRLAKVDLTAKRIFSTAELGDKDVKLVGAKAANYAELATVLNPLMGYDIVRPGLAIPFAFYNDFMQRHAQSLDINKQLAKLKHTPTSTVKETILANLRKQVMALPVDQKLIEAVQLKLAHQYPHQKMRFRSSTNSEDLHNFSGAGLYTSSSFNPKKRKKTIAKAIKTVWASVWNRRAYDEREYYGIDHTTVYAAILLSPSFANEEGNGVAISRNITPHRSHSNPHAIYLNNQFGEHSITNPTPGIKGEEVLIYYSPTNPITPTTQYSDMQFLARSSETKVAINTGKRQPVFKPTEYNIIVTAIRAAHQHFKKQFDPNNLNPTFALDLEYKVDDLDTSTRKIYFKQARPYVAHE